MQLHCWGGHIILELFHDFLCVITPFGASVCAVLGLFGTKFALRFSPQACLEKNDRSPIMKE
jgi:hypothetical protein